jgi:hypothetical protein
MSTINQAIVPLLLTLSVCCKLLRVCQLLLQLLFAGKPLPGAKPRLQSKLPLQSLEDWGPSKVSAYMPQEDKLPEEQAD